MINTIKVKEFCSDVVIEKSINEWLEKNQAIELIDIKYSADVNSSNALIIYKTEK